MLRNYSSEFNISKICHKIMCNTFIILESVEIKFGLLFVKFLMLGDSVLTSNLWF